MFQIVKQGYRAMSKLNIAYMASTGRPRSVCLHTTHIHLPRPSTGPAQTLSAQNQNTLIISDHSTESGYPALNIEDGQAKGKRLGQR